MFHRNKIIVATLALLVISGCSKKQTATGYVARVGDVSLSAEEMARMTGGQHAAQLSRQFVSNWVTNELLYQEARRHGFTEAEDVLQQIESAKRRLAIDAYLQKQIYSDDESSISPGDIEQEYKEHRDADRLREDVVKMSFAVFDDRDAANSFRLKLLRGASWRKTIEEMNADAATKSQLLRVATEEYFTQGVLFPEELWKIARALNKNVASYVVKTDAGYCVVIVHETWKQGDVPEFEYVKEEITQRLLMRKRKTQYDELLTSLRSKYSVDVNLDSMGAAGNSTSE